MKRRTFLLVPTVLFFASVRAQTPTKVRRIGFLAARSRSTPSRPDVYYDAFVRGMRELGYEEGKNLVIEWRYAEGNYERIPALARELAGANVEVIVAHGTQSAQALQRATKTVPIVFTPLTDPIGAGVAASLARPGGNLTGLTNMMGDVSGKQLELLKRLTPSLSRVGMLVNPGNSATDSAARYFEIAAKQSGIAFVRIEARSPAEIERGVAESARQRVEALVVPDDAFFLGQRAQIGNLGLTHRIALLCSTSEYVLAGALLSYGPDLTEGYRHVATYVDRILKGERPGVLPIEQPTTLRFALNGKTAKALGLTIPQDLRLRADEVIE